jgi:hypothetical protein
MTHVLAIGTPIGLAGALFGMYGDLAWPCAIALVALGALATFLLLKCSPRD